MGILGGEAVRSLLYWGAIRDLYGGVGGAIGGLFYRGGNEGSLWEYLGVRAMRGLFCGGGGAMRGLHFGVLDGGGSIRNPKMMHLGFGGLLGVGGIYFPFYMGGGVNPFTLQILTIGKRGGSPTPSF